MLKSKLAGLFIGCLALVSAYLYLQHIITQRDAYQAQAEHQRERAEILIEHQQFQRQRIETLSNVLAARERTLETIDDDIGASTGALEPLGEQDAKAGDWLDSDLPDGVVDWVRELQRSGAANAVQQPPGTGTSNQ
ncbi:Phage lysis regulatory protein, LysB family [Halomonas sp. NYA30]